jgi:hypothetical protein
MGLLAFLKRLIFGRDEFVETVAKPQPQSAATVPRPKLPRSGPRQWTRARLGPLEHRSSLVKTSPKRERGHKSAPYPFASIDLRRQYLDLSTDADTRWLDYYGLPHLTTPAQLADWLKIPLGKLAWLTGRYWETRRPMSAKQAHYHFRWRKKRSGGYRLIESPKTELRRIQQQILRGILDKVPPHAQAHGFVQGRSIRTNAEPHVGKRVIVKFDLENFYASLKFSRVVAIYRSLGFSREVGLWLARLTTSMIPWSLEPPEPGWNEIEAYQGRHLPQGAATSPALANLSAYALDVRLAGLAAKYGADYTRYADDLTFSAHGKTVPALKELIPLIEKVVRDERFRTNKEKRKVVRRNQRQVVAGVVVNDRLSAPRPEYDRLKAILHNCIKLGPRSQNRANHADFAGHLLGRIAHVRHLNPHKGAKLLAIYGRIDWRK